MPSIYPDEGFWFKGNLHSHSTASDGWLAPERVVQCYREMGYDFICMTDHWLVTPLPVEKKPDFLYLHGVELNGGWTGVGDYHFIGIDLPGNAAFTQPADRNTLKPGDLIRMLCDYDALVALAHPSWNGVSWPDLFHKPGSLWALEAWNTGCDVELGRGVSDVQWDDLLSRGCRLHGIAVDDGHRYYIDAGKGWVMVKAAELSRKAVRTALEQGHFYSSTGPLFKDIQIESGKLVVQTTPVRRIAMISAPRRGDMAIAAEGDHLTGHAFDLSRAEKYARIRITDAIGRQAWSNPIYL